jgi:hypothetical protein
MGKESGAADRTGYLAQPSRYCLSKPSRLLLRAEITVKILHLLCHLHRRILLLPNLLLQVAGDKNKWPLTGPTDADRIARAAMNTL